MTLVKRDIGELLVDNGQITPEELEHAQAESKTTGDPLSVVLSKLGLVNKSQLKSALELEYGVNYIGLKETVPDADAIALVPESLCLEFEAVPLSKDSKRVTLAMVTPSDQSAISAFKAKCGDRLIKPVVCLEEDFADFIKRAYPPRAEEPATPRAKKGGGKAAQTTSDSTPELEAERAAVEAALPAHGVTEVEDMAIMLLGNHILSSAISKGCTNIHIEPTEKQVLVHYRKDGVLFAARKLPRAILPDLVRRFKSLAETSSAERSLPFDAQLDVQLSGETVSFRLSIVTGAYGEHLVIWLT